jgi:protein TonB
MAIKQFLALMACMCFAAVALAQTEQPKKPMRLRVSSGVAEKMKVHNVQPKYPREAREKGIEGDVLLQATIDTKGDLVNLNAVQGDRILVEAAIDAVKKWKYRPYVLNGEPVEVETTIKIQFYMR